MGCGGGKLSSLHGTKQVIAWTTGAQTWDPYWLTSYSAGGLQNKGGGGGQGTIIISKKKLRITYEYLTIENWKAKFTKASSVEREFWREGHVRSSMWKNYQWRLGVPFHDRLRQNGFIFIFEICRIGKEKNKQIKTNHSHDNVTQGYISPKQLRHAMRWVKRRDEYQTVTATATERYLNRVLSEYLKIFLKKDLHLRYKRW